MANITPYITEIQNAVYGEEVRSSIINALVAVNDDNESYQAIKTAILNAKDAIDDQVEAFDGKVEDAEELVGSLDTAITSAGTALSSLNGAITNAGTANTALSGVIATATSKKSDLDTSVSNANTAISSAGSAKTALEAVVSTAGTAKTQLETAITNAGTAKTQLETAISTAGTSKTNLETAISNASTAKTQLNAVISDADTIKTALSTVITNAGTAKTQLEGVISSATTIYNQLSAENTSAVANLEALRSEDFNAQEILAGVTDIKAYLGMIETENVLGVCVDYTNKSFTRIAGAVGKTAGTDFNDFGMYGGRKKVIVADDGTIVAEYGDNDYVEDGSLGQVMIKQPKFYYLVAPLEYDPISTGIGYHLRKANYYITTKQRAGFKLHPAFYDKNGVECDYILIGAYEGSIWDYSAEAYLLDDEQVMDVSNDLFCSIAGARPASGKTQDLTRVKINTMCKNRGDGWYSMNVKIACMEWLLMLIEYASWNMQTAIGKGVVDLPWTTGSDTTSSYAGATGSTASFGNGTGRASSTTTYEGGSATAYTVDGKTSICYRGLENMWGNMFKFVNGVNIWGNGQMGGGQPFVCKDFNYAESKKDDNYEGAGFTVANADGYIKAFGYSTKYDWLFMPSDVGSPADSSLPVGDYFYKTTDLNAYRIARLGGSWIDGLGAGLYWSLYSGVGYRSRYFGGRLVYVPTQTA